MKKRPNSALITLLIIAFFSLVIFIYLCIFFFVIRGGEKKGETVSETEQITEWQEDADAAGGTQAEAGVSADEGEAGVDANEAATQDYKTVYLQRAQAFQAECAQRFAGAEDDLARFCLMDMDLDGVPELIMHDVAGEHASYCTYKNGVVSDVFSIYDNAEQEAAVQNYGAYATLYKNMNLYIKYEFSNNYAESGYGGIKQVLMPEHKYKQTVTSSFYSIDVVSGAPVLMGSLKFVRSGSGEKYKYKFYDADGKKIEKKEYKKRFREFIGEDNFRSFFISEAMMADGDYDFRSELLWNSTPSAKHMTLEEFTSYLSALG
ncbi:MAG: hypothetical protein K6G06_02755 [Butyrivibrio sp.]|nr:hypothetical protein [Butyrivibrio sp.]